MKERRQPEWAINIAPDLDKPESIVIKVKRGEHAASTVRSSVDAALLAAQAAYDLLSSLNGSEDDEPDEDDPEPEPAEGAQEAVDLGDGREVPDWRRDRMTELPKRSWIRRDKSWT